MPKLAQPKFEIMNTRFIKIIKGIVLLLFSIILIVIVVSTVAYQNYWAKDSQGKLDESYLTYFKESYVECRQSFLSELTKLRMEYKNVQIGSIQVESELDTGLSVDWLYVPAQIKREKLLILTSGLHGIEGYTGSAIQLMFLDRILEEAYLDSISILLIHGLNPFGFKYDRKVTENNVDLNRNCVIDNNFQAYTNDGYGKLKDLLMPEGPVALNNFRNRFFHLVAINKIVQESMPVLRQAALQGQYEYEEGIYYGGNRYEPQIEAVESILKTVISEHDIILNIDLHTAYGKRGNLHMFLNPVDDSVSLRNISAIFDTSKVDWGSAEDFYTINGEYVGWVGDMAGGTVYIPMLYEFGTMDIQKTFGSLKSIQVMINENQGVNYGYKDKKVEAKVKSDFREMYYPSSHAWRSKVLKDAHIIMLDMMEKYSKFEPIKQ